MSDYSEDRAWSDRFLPQVQYTLARHLGISEDLIWEAPDHLDRKRATDLIAAGRHVAVRLRRAACWRKFRPLQFTVRNWRANGMLTEQAKIEEGFGEAMFYGAISEDGRLIAWMLISLNAFRAHLSKPGTVTGMRQLGDLTVHKNHDAETGFIAYRVAGFPPDPPILIPPRR